MTDFGMPNLDPSIGQPLAAPIQMPAPKKKGGMFGSGKGNIGEAISAAILGALASRGNPGATLGLRELYQRRQAGQEREQAALDRENQFQDFVRREAYKAANPGAPDPTAFQKDYAWYQQNQPGMAEQFARAHAASGGSPFGSLFTDPATGQRYMMGPQQQLPAIGSVVADPRKQGGPTPPASGGFPGPY